eukprot:CAMPEP_0181331216 /NCGR_PEP_ID=MMETSP1101-20121128/24374_1 /TAXON_ID=46948 /ORGANISM="Rhodomonas abbreviata, Strain Caron Lab Isolate" /LENGTH=63 /DNA_ID=CAMNT_0023440643 /DNA_START=51 /DNA_END=242 /DNA_ORIENTATION=-
MARFRFSSSLLFTSSAAAGGGFARGIDATCSSQSSFMSFAAQIATYPPTNIDAKAISKIMLKV